MDGVCAAPAAPAPEPGTVVGIGGGAFGGGPPAADVVVSKSRCRCARRSRLASRYWLVDDESERARLLVKPLVKLLDRLPDDVMVVVLVYLGSVGGGTGLADVPLSRLDELVYMYEPGEAADAPRLARAFRVASGDAAEDAVEAALPLVAAAPLVAPLVDRPLVDVPLAAWPFRPLSPLMASRRSTSSSRTPSAGGGGGGHFYYYTHTNTEGGQHGLLPDLHVRVESCSTTFVVTRTGCPGRRSTPRSSVAEPSAPQEEARGPRYTEINRP